MATPADWDLALDVNVRAHIAAAERLLPGWLERGSGYFLTTASAAGIATPDRLRALRGHQARGASPSPSG